MKKILIILLLSFSSGVVVLNNVIIAKLGGVSMCYVAVTHWSTHMQHGVFPLPWNNYVAEYNIKNKAAALVDEFEVGLQIDVGVMLYASLFEDRPFDDAARVTSVLLDAGANINYVSPVNGCTFVRNLIVNDAIQAANYLLDKGADLSISNPQSRYPICSESAESILERYPLIREK